MITGTTLLEEVGPLQILVRDSGRRTRVDVEARRRPSIASCPRKPGLRPLAERISLGNGQLRSPVI